MKKISIIVITLFVQNSFAELKWVRGPFWKTVYENSFTAQLVNSDKEIIKECAEFENMVWDKYGKPTGIDAELFSSIDTMTLANDMMNESFQLDFKVALAPNLTVATQLQTRPDILAMVNTEAQLDVLPNYTQLPSEIKLLPQTFKNLPNIITSNSQSLSNAAIRLHTALKPIQVIHTGAEVYVRVQSKALACDLLNDKALIQLNALAEVKISGDSEVKLQTSYNEIKSTSLNLINFTVNPILRAALFGFRIGAILEKSGKYDNEETEKRMLALLNHLFDAKNMNLSPVWVDGLNQTKTLPIDGVSKPVDATLIIRGSNQ
ncbi:hypothetical protein CIK05_08915 [Bdellovibrio sp. qaytius]|nr:hypothetical protein CIK05_08915 [Bdellovibrio sp. qaytius]